MVVDIDTSDQVHFAVTGKSWHLLKQYFPEVIPKVRSTWLEQWTALISFGFICGKSCN